jgi:ATP-dependent RNA circularization protein (DNA/RNA ligase family)
MGEEMSEYHKIQTIFKRDMATKHKTLIEGDWSLPEFGYLAANEWHFTEKVDGTNIRVMFDNGKVTFGGRTDNAQIQAQLVERLNDRFRYEDNILSEIFGDGKATLYGEGYGAKIQKGGGNYRQDQDFVLFDVRVGDWWLQRKDVYVVAEKLGLDVVPYIGQGTLYDAVNKAKDGIRSMWGDFQAEGIVARPMVELRTRGGERIIAKIKCRDFAK